MSHDIYAFGSIVRGDVLPTSDVDILVVSDSEESGNYPSEWSVYSPKLLEKYYLKGRLFAWHLHLDAILIYTSSERDCLTRLGTPVEYSSGLEDISELTQILKVALNRIYSGSKSEIFEYGIVYTALRDIAMSASYYMLDRPNFSRHAPYELPLRFPLSKETYEKAMMARHCSTRGLDCLPCFAEERDEMKIGIFDEWLFEIEKAL